LINDVKTLLSESSTQKLSIASANNARFQKGDNKQHYAEKSYKTQSISLTERQGQQADLLNNINAPLLGLPAVPIPSDNPMFSRAS
jgi:cytochrome c peroxidase